MQPKIWKFLEGLVISCKPTSKRTLNVAWPFERYVSISSCMSGSIMEVETSLESSGSILKCLKYNNANQLTNQHNLQKTT